MQRAGIGVLRAASRQPCTASGKNELPALDNFSWGFGVKRPLFGPWLGPSDWGRARAAGVKIIFFGVSWLLNGSKIKNYILSSE